MKYGQLSQGTTSVDTNRSVQVARGSDSERPIGTAGTVRYNTDTQVIGRGDNDGTGRFEAHTGEWKNLVTEKDFEHSEDQASKQDINDNLMFKMIAEQLSDTFVTAAGSISLIQGGLNFGDTTGSTDLPGYFTNVKLNGGSTTTGNMNNQAGSNVTEAFKTFLGSNKISEVTVNSTGAGYTNPRVLVDTLGGSGAVIRVLTIGGKVVKSGITIISSGKNYRDNHTKILLKGGGFKKIGVIKPVIQDGAIVDIEVLDTGSGYLNNPQVIISDGGYGARLLPVVHDGKITKVKVINPGYDYSVTPVVRIIDSSTPTTDANLTVVIGGGKVINIQLLRPIICQFLDNGKYDLSVTGGGGTGCKAYLNVQNGGGESVVITNPGNNYTSEPNVSIVNFPGVVTDLNFQKSATNVIMRFNFDIFKSCGIPRSKATRYDVSLLTTVNKAVPYDAHYAGQVITMSVNLSPSWSPLDNYNHANYGVYSGAIDLYGMKHYYRSGVGASWMANMVKSR